MGPFITEELERLESAALRRTLKAMDGPQGTHIIVDGRACLQLCSNDYLALANHPLLKEAAIKATERYGTGAGASRLVSGNMALHRELEERISEFKSTEASLLFNSGYNANLGVITALAGRGAHIFSDRLNHASIVDACVLSRARFTRYPHRDVATLERMLERSTTKQKLIVTDGVFSMDGTIAPVKELSALAGRYGATLIIDDAHATGVLGARGRGTLEHFGIQACPGIIEMGTLGKALGSFGAFIADSRELIDLLVSKARPFIFTTALPPAVCAASSKALEIVEAQPELIKKLRDNADLLRSLLSQAGLCAPEGETPIVPIPAGEAEKALALSERLLEAGVFIQAIRPPTVPAGTSRLRATVSAAHTEEDITQAVAAIKEAFDARI